MEPETVRVLKLVKTSLLGTALVGAGVFLSHAETSWDGEKLSLEINMQRRVEKALSKILSPEQFVVVVKVEPWAKPKNLDSGTTISDEGDQYFLPGVPARRRLDGTAEAIGNLADSLKPEQKVFMHFVRRISATLVLDQDLKEGVVENARALTRQILGLDAQRGDTLEVQTTVFNKAPLPTVDNSPMSRLQRGVQSYWPIISLALIVFSITIFFLFVFGPLRGFLNRFVQVLPTLKPQEQPQQRSPRLSAMESPILPALMAQAQSMGIVPQLGAPPGNSPANFSGSLMVENPNRKTTPFGFIREDHLGNLPTLLARETPEKAAVVLGYLPAEWISRVLSKMEPAVRSEITDHLAQTRQLLPEQVEDIEQDLKRRLDYLIGGPDRIIAVYESLDAEQQRQMLDNLRISQPELADELRRRTFLFEELERMDAKHLKIVLREIDLQTLVLCMRGISDAFRDKILENLSAGKAEIVKEELDYSDGPASKATYDAQRKVTLLVRQLEREGQIQLDNSKPNSPPVRYGSSLKSVLKLPPGMKEDEEIQTVEAKPIDEDIEGRIRSFMNRQPQEKERFPIKDEQTLVDEPPDSESKG